MNTLELLDEVLNRLLEDKYPHVEARVMLSSASDAEVRLVFKLFAAIEISKAKLAAARANPDKFLGDTWVEVQSAVREMAASVQTEDTPTERMLRNLVLEALSFGVRGIGMSCVDDALRVGNNLRSPCGECWTCRSNAAIAHRDKP